MKKENPAEIAFSAISSVSRILTGAVNRKQKISVEISAGDRELPPERLPSGTLSARGELDGSYRIIIEVEAPKK